MRNGEWAELCDVLRAALPIVNHRFYIKRVRMADHGNTSLSSSRRTITITIRAQDAFPTQKDSLLHEWGHALEFDRWKEHSTQWAKDYAKAYNVIEKHCDMATQNE